MAELKSSDCQWSELKLTPKLTDKEKPGVTMYKWIEENQALNLECMNNENLIKWKPLLLGFGFKIIAPEG